MHNAQQAVHAWGLQQEGAERVRWSIAGGMTHDEALAVVKA
jgi:hypothetical protein